MYSSVCLQCPFDKSFRVGFSILLLSFMFIDQRKDNVLSVWYADGNLKRTKKCNIFIRTQVSQYTVIRSYLDYINKTAYLCMYLWMYFSVLRTFPEMTSLYLAFYVFTEKSKRERNTKRREAKKLTTKIRLNKYT